MTTPRSRLEARIEPELDRLIAEAAAHLNVTKTAFVTDTIREAALKVTSRAQVTLMDAQVFDMMMTELEVADESTGLEALRTLPRRINT